MRQGNMKRDPRNRRVGTAYLSKVAQIHRTGLVKLALIGGWGSSTELGKSEKARKAVYQAHCLMSTGQMRESSP